MVVSWVKFSSNDHNNLSVTSSNPCEPATPLRRKGMPKYGPFYVQYGWPRRWREITPIARRRHNPRTTAHQTITSQYHSVCGL